VRVEDVKSSRVSFVLAQSTDATPWMDLVCTAPGIRSVYEGALGFSRVEIVELSEANRRVLRVYPSTFGIAGPIAKLMGREFHYVERGHFEGGVYHFSATPSVFAEVATVTGTTSCQAHELTTELHISAKIPLFGHAIESLVVKLFEEGWERLRPYAGKHVRV
jgi:Protein of unknown function (DUF2505)